MIFINIWIFFQLQEALWIFVELVAWRSFLSLLQAIPVNPMARKSEKENTAKASIHAKKPLYKEHFKGLDI